MARDSKKKMNINDKGRERYLSVGERLSLQYAKKLQEKDIYKKSTTIFLYDEITRLRKYLRYVVNSTLAEENNK